MGSIKVLLVNNRATQREGLCLLLKKTPDITVVGETGDKADTRSAFLGQREITFWLDR